MAAKFKAKKEEKRRQRTKRKKVAAEFKAKIAKGLSREMKGEQHVKKKVNTEFAKFAAQEEKKQQ